MILPAVVAMYWVIVSIFKFLQKRNQFSKHKNMFVLNGCVYMS